MRSAIPFACLLAMTSCGQPPASNEANEANDAAPAMPAPTLPEGNAPTTVPAPTPPPRPSETPTAGNLVVPATAPPSLPESRGPINPRSAEAAAQVVQRYGALLEERQFATARKLWGSDGAASGLTQAQFIAAYDKYADIHAEVGAPGNSEGAAGSIYVDVPLRLYGTLKTGKPFNLVGPVSLRRVNDVAGATAAQLRWHIFQSGLKPRP